MASNRVIGYNNSLPWHLPKDLAHFKRVTLGHPVIMGRKTWLSIGQRPLPNRHNIVLSQNNTQLLDLQTKNHVTGSLSITNSLESALALCQTAENVFIIGGSSVYRAALSIASRFYLTEVDTICEGDSVFPAWDKKEWVLLQKTNYHKDEQHKYNFTISLFERRGALCHHINTSV